MIVEAQLATLSLAQLLGLVAPIVGAIVSFDVGAFEATSDSTESRFRRANRHASYHAGFLTLGVCSFEGLGAVLYVLFEGLIVWLKGLELPFIDLTFLNALSMAPRFLMLALTVWMFSLLYDDKFEGASDKSKEDAGDPENLPGIFQRKRFAWLKRRVSRLPREHIAAIAVSLDMWYLTPLLRTLLEGLPIWVYAAFIAIVYAMVFVSCLGVISVKRRFINSGQLTVSALTFVLTFLVFGEMLGSGVFAFRNIEMVAFNGTMNNPMIWIYLSFMFVCHKIAKVGMQVEAGDEEELEGESSSLARSLWHVWRWPVLRIWQWQIWRVWTWELWQLRPRHFILGFNAICDARRWAAEQTVLQVRTA